MSAQPTRIQVDTAEQPSGIPSLLSGIDGVTVEMARLEIGDYLCADDVVVERKTAVDFIASILDRRLFEQVAKMVAGYETAILVLEGDVYATRSGIAPVALDGALSWLATLSGITVLPSNGVEHSARLIATIARHAQHGLGYEIPLRHAKRCAPGRAKRWRVVRGSLASRGVKPLWAGGVRRTAGRPRPAKQINAPVPSTRGGLGSPVAVYRGPAHPA